MLRLDKTQSNRDIDLVTMADFTSSKRSGVASRQA